MRTLLRCADMLDGTGAEPRRADILMLDGRLSVLPPGTAEVGDGVDVIETDGLIVAPGFVDVHTHSDALALRDSADPDLVLAAVRQGVTTEIVGNCGLSMFPAAEEPENEAGLSDYVGTLFGGDIEPLRDLAAFEDAHRQAKRVNHVASLVGHSTLRAAVMGFTDAAPTSYEIDRMCTLLDRLLESGAVGLSTGLIYPPGVFADTSELVALAAVAARHSRPYVTHLRDEMSRVEDALDEAREIGRRAGVAVHVSHHKTAGRVGWGRTTRTLRMMDAARADGVDVTCDVYPYTAASTHLHAMLPPWMTAGGIDALLERLRQPGLRAAARASLQHGEPGWENTVGNGGWDLIHIASAPGRPDVQGRSVAELAAEAGCDAVDYVADLLAAERARVTVISHSMAEADVRRVLAHPGTMVGSDGIPREGRPHPRWAGSFARVLGPYARDAGLFGLGEAVHRMTALPARRFGLSGRGRIADGWVADLVVFDQESVTDRATYDDPLATPDGVRDVFVAGVPVVRDGEPTGALPGGVVRMASAGGQ